MNESISSAIREPYKLGVIEGTKISHQVDLAALSGKIGYKKNERWANGKMGETIRKI